MKKASILINNYNNAPFLKECIDSALQQSYSYVEVIVCDDCSTDSSMDILLQYRGRINIVSNDIHTQLSHVNQYRAIMNAFNVSTGDVILLLDSDDCFMKEKIESIMPFFEDEEVVYVQHLLEEIDSNSSALHTTRPLWIRPENYKSYIEQTGSIISLFSQTSGQAYSRKFFGETIEKINEQTHPFVWTDARLPYHAVFQGKIISIDKALGYYRIHGQNDSSKLSTLCEYNRFLEQSSEYFIYVATQYKQSISLLPIPNMLSHSSTVRVLMDLSFIQYISQLQPIIIWGAGEAGRGLYQLLSSYKLNIVAFIEGNSKKHGEVIDGLVVHGIEILEKYATASVIVTPYYAINAIVETINQMSSFTGEVINPYSREGEI